jgi:hypothetical protein
LAHGFEYYAARLGLYTLAWLGLGLGLGLGPGFELGLGLGLGLGFELGLGLGLGLGIAFECMPSPARCHRRTARPSSSC